jgi:uncharacterized repeat protein (TIGR01451 family)
MKAKRIFGGVTLSGIIAAVAISGTALAWHPQGTITKSVQDITANGTMQQADTDAAAVTVKPGDVLDYEIVISNTASKASNNENDMANTVMTDTLPNGIELLSNTSETTITQNIGTIKPGDKVTEDYVVKVTANTDGEIITNKACFTGNSVVNDDAQSGCDVAEIKVSNPAAPTPAPTPTTPATTTPTPTTPAPSAPAPAVPAPQSIPNTGPGGDAIVLGVFSAAAGYIGYVLRLKNKVSA